MTPGSEWCLCARLGQVRALMPCGLFVADLEQPLGAGKIRVYAVSGGHVQLVSGEVRGDSLPAGVVQIVATMPPDLDPSSRHRLECAPSSADSWRRLRTTGRRTPTCLRSSWTPPMTNIRVRFREVSVDCFWNWEAVNALGYLDGPAFQELLLARAGPGQISQ